MAVEAGRRHVRKLVAKLGGREGAVAQEGLHDPEPDRVQQQVGAGHGDSAYRTISKRLTFLEVRSILLGQGPSSVNTGTEASPLPWETRAWSARSIALAESTTTFGFHERTAAC